MEIDFRELRKFIEESAKPRWEHPDAEWPMRPGGGEIYIQEKVLKRGAPYLAEDSIREATRENILGALKSNANLLSQYDYMFAAVFVAKTPEDELNSRLVNLLYGSEDLASRLRVFLDWAKKRGVPGETKKMGINEAAASYLLALTNPREYAFCKPRAYNAGTRQFLDKNALGKMSVDRILHCNEFYKEVLQLLETDYGLQDGNLFDVHSIFYLLSEELEKSSQKPLSVQKGMTSDLPKSEINELLLERHNLILYGPPGTGKTREVLILANQWKQEFGEDCVLQVTFHPSYCYEDFIEGYRPDPGNGGFSLRGGVFKKFCASASREPTKKFLLIVDEINRGDVARILGETITLIEGDKRGEGYSVTLQQSGDHFFIPENVYLLGTMNTADKSISLMDLAIRRRFLFIPCRPNPDVIDESKSHVNQIAGVQLSQLLIGINQRLVDAGIDGDRAIGHSYFLIRKESANPLGSLQNRFKFEIIPLLEEYFYADKTRLYPVLGGLVDEFGQTSDEVFEDRDRFIETLRSLRITG